MSDPGKYRTTEEVEERKRTHDPVRLARAKLLELGVGEKELASLDEEIEAEVQDAVKFADESEPATVHAMNELVLAPEGASDA